jgi:hypothetical protein
MEVSDNTEKNGQQNERNDRQRLPKAKEQVETNLSSKNETSSKRMESGNSTTARISIYDFPDTPPQKKNRGKLVGTTFFIHGQFSVPKKVLKQLIIREGGKISVTLSSKVR